MEGHLYQTLKKYCQLFTKVDAQIILWESLLLNSTTAFGSIVSVLPRMKMICSTERAPPKHYGVLQQFTDIHILLQQKHVERVETLTRALRGYLESFRKATERIHSQYMAGVELFQTQVSPTQDKPLSPAALCAKTVDLPSILNAIEWLELIDNMYSKEYFIKMDLLEKLQYAHLPDISYIEKLYGAWSAEFSIDRSKVTSIMNQMSDIAKVQT